MNKCYLDKVCVSVHGINSKQECWPHRQIFRKIYVPINVMPHPQVWAMSGVGGNLNL